MNTHQSTPEGKKELVDAFSAYTWLVVKTNPVKRMIHLIRTPIPPYIAKEVEEYKEQECTRYYIENKIEPPYILSSHSVDLLLMQVIQTGIPLYKVSGKDISCVADIKRLWDDAGLSNSTILEWKEIYRVMAYLKPQNLQIEKELMAELEPGKNTSASIPQKQGNIFCCLGDTWEITFEKNRLQVKDRLYMNHIQYVLENPLKILSLLDLDKVFEKKQQTDAMKEQQKECMDILSVSSNSGTIEKQDNEDSKKYLKKEVEKLQDEIEIARETQNSEKEAELQAQLDELSKYVSDGLHKTRIPGRKGKNEASILRGINRCIDSIKTASSKADTGKLIAEHIDKNIERSKYHIIYKPENQPNWNL